MPTETVTPPAAATPPPAPSAAPAAPVVPAKPVTPTIPAAQSASVKNQPANKNATTNSRTPPDAPPSLQNEMTKLAEQHFAPKKAEATPTPAEAPPKPAEAPTKAAEAPSTPEKPVATTEKEALDIPEPKGMSPENLANWKAWREQAKKEINEEKNRAATLAAKLKTYETALPADSDKAAKLEAQLKEVQDRLAVYDVKSTPDYIRQYVEPKKNALKEAAEIVAYNGKEGVNLAAVLDKPLKDFNAEVSELTKEMNGMDAATVQNALRNAYKITNDEKAALANAGELKAKIEAKYAAESRKAFEDTRGDVTSKVPEMPVPEGASEEKIAEINSFNKARAEALAEAEQYSFGKMSDRKVAEIAHQAAMLKPVATILIPQLQRDLKKSNSLVAELSAELAAIKKGKNPGTFVEAGKSAKADTSNMDVRALAKQMLGANDPRG